MPPIIDLDLPLPPTAEQIARDMKRWALGRGEKGVANYRYIFGPGKARELGVTLDELEHLSRALSDTAFDDLLLEYAQTLVISLADFVHQMDEAGIVWGAFRNVDNDVTAEIISQFPDRFVGQALASPHDGMQGVRELERAIKELPRDKEVVQLYQKVAGADPLPAR